MNLGGATITVTDNDFPDSVKTKTFYSSYAAFDVTDPTRAPTLLWENDFGGVLGYTTNIPTVVKVKEKWFLAIGSGPTSYDGASTQKGTVIIVDLKTGQNVKTFEADDKAFMNSPVALDKNLNYSVSAIYAGSTYRAEDGSRKGGVWKLVIPPLKDSSGKYNYDPSCKDCFDDDPANWYMIKLFDAAAPFTAPFSLTVDQADNVWVFMGTGSFVTASDKDNGDQQYLYGIKDPFYNRRGISALADAQTADNTCFGNYEQTCALTSSDLFDASPYAIKSDGTVQLKDGYITDPDSLAGKSYDDFLKDGVRKKTTGVPPMEIYQGWLRELLIPDKSCPCVCISATCDSTSSCMTDPACTDPCVRTSCKASERVLVKPAVFGGIALFPTFTPDPDPCRSGGSSNLYGLYYETGTAYKRSVFKKTDSDTILDMIVLGTGLASTPAIHVGKEEGQKGTAFMQMSTGQIVQVLVDPIFNVKSGIQFWRNGR